VNVVSVNGVGQVHIVDATSPETAAPGADPGRPGGSATAPLAPHGRRFAGCC